MAENKIIRNQINLAKENNQNAFNYLLNTYWEDVFSFQLKRTKNESLAEDITIESFTKAFEKINTYNEKYIFKTWLITISKKLKQPINNVKVRVMRAKRVLAEIIKKSS